MFFSNWKVGQCTKVLSILMFFFQMFFTPCVCQSVVSDSDPVHCSQPGSSVHGILQEWSGLPCPSPGDLPNPGIETEFSTLHTDFFTTWSTREVLGKLKYDNIYKAPSESYVKPLEARGNSPPCKSCPTTLELKGELFPTHLTTLLQQPDWKALN